MMNLFKLVAKSQHFFNKIEFSAQNTEKIKSELCGIRTKVEEFHSLKIKV